MTDGIYYYTLEVYNNAHHQKEFYSGDIAIFSQDKWCNLAICFDIQSNSILTKSDFFNKPMFVFWNV